MARAEIAAAPAGTEFRTESGASWQTATIGTELETGYEVRNTQVNAYTVRLSSNSAIKFDAAAVVDLVGVSGTVEYKNAQGNWIQVQSSGTVEATIVATQPGGGVGVITSLKGVVPPPPWK